jgi:hypothetical protein
MSDHGTRIDAVNQPQTGAEDPTTSLGLPLLALLGAIAVCLLAYLVFAIPGSWFPGVAVKTWSPRELVVVKGAGEMVKGALHMAGPDTEGQSLVVANGEIRARDFAAIEWDATGAQKDTEYRLVWRSDYAPQKLIAIPITVDSHRLLPVSVRNVDGWLGNITFLGLLIRGPLPEPLQIVAVRAKPMGAIETLRDRFREWTTHENVSGTSINIVAGGSDVQSLPLPFLLGGAILLAAAALWGLRRFRHRLTATALAGSVAVMFVASWLILDARWMVNLAGETRGAIQQFAGKDWRHKHLAADDGPLFEFIEKVRKQLPGEPARVIIAADEHYFRGRAAFHLYPQRVYFDPSRNVLPTPDQLRPGDFLVVYQRRGIAYDPAAGLLRWDGNTPVKARLKLVDRGAALFEIL